MLKGLAEQMETRDSLNSNFQCLHKNKCVYCQPPLYALEKTQAHLGI